MTPTKTTPGNPQVVAGGSVIKNHSQFNNSYPVVGTYRFGEYTPHFVAESVPADKDMILRSSSALRSYTLKSPILNNVKLHKDYFNVPLQAIIPFNYEKFKVAPVQGDDCPDDAGTTLLTGVKNFHDFLVIHAPATFGGSPSEWQDFFRWLVAAQWFFSFGSLLSVCEIRLNNRLSIRFNYNGTLTICDIDQFVDMVLTDMATYMETNGKSFSATFGGTQYAVYASVAPDNVNPVTISLREFFYRFMSQPNATLDFNLETITAWIPNCDLANSFSFNMVGGTDIPIDLRRLHAYNLVCAHFYSNDHIDYVFKAALYRQNQYSFIKLSGYDAGMRFIMNGVPFEYDALSAHAVQIMLLDNQATHTDNVFSYLSNIFNLNRSLRFMDYFTGARSNPLAVGNTNVPVSGSNVSVIDITKGIQRQRFLNAVNRSGSRFESYIKNLFGVKPAYDYHNPFFLGSTVDDVITSEIENTGNAQFSDISGLDFETKKNSITSRFAANSSRYAFNFDSDRDSVLIGITYFDIPRYYPFGIPRIAQHLNRYDDFVPQAQFIGDQDIKKSELGATISPNSPFAYTGRYQEYKMRVPYCFGGVFHRLRSWAYFAQYGDINGTISPDFIRSIQTELDKFYLSLTSYSLAGYYHFIISTNNDFGTLRPMVKHPHIL